jgi:hypothetical protein
MNDYQNFKMQKINRNEINEAYYNPRKIKKENREKLKKMIKKNGLIMPLIWNKRTGNCVSGHQRLSILDELNKNNEYQLEVATIDVDEQKEVELNIFLNNTSTMGEWDKEMLIDLRETFPDLNFEIDLGFEKFDLDFFEIPYEKKEINKNYENRIDQFEQYKSDFDDYKKNIKEQEKINGNSKFYPERNNKMLTIIFENNIQKKEFMQLINKKEMDKFCKYEEIIDILKNDYRL